MVTSGGTHMIMMSTRLFNPDPSTDGDGNQKDLLACRIYLCDCGTRQVCH